MKKLTPENRVEAQRQIQLARVNLAEYRERKLSTFTDEGRDYYQGLLGCSRMVD